MGFSAEGQRPTEQQLRLRRSAGDTVRRTLLCCVTGSDCRHRSKVWRVRVASFCSMSTSRYANQMTGILCMNTSARSNTLFRISQDGCVMQRPWTCTNQEAQHQGASVGRRASHTAVSAEQSTPTFWRRYFR